jgi:hypothetical protein
MAGRGFFYLCRVSLPMRNPLHYILFCLPISLLLLVAVQGSFGVFGEKSLPGEVYEPSPCVFTCDSLLSGDFQKCVTVILDQHMGFYRTLVRMNNQASYSLFGVSNAKNVVIGKDHYLYERMYLDAYLGKDCNGFAKTSGMVSRLLQFQGIMERHQVRFLFVLCPSKPRVMPEYLPDRYRKAVARTNYSMFADILAHEGRGLHWIDMNRYFLQMKDTCPYPLYPRGGTHWTNFSADYYALDTILGYLGHIGGRSVPHLSPGEVRWSDSLVSPDDDLSEILNLACPFPGGKLPYASFRIDTAGRSRPDALVIGDSYFWLIYGFRQVGSVFKHLDFWAWNRDYYPKSTYEGVTGEDYMFLKKALLSHEYLILAVTETNLTGLLEFDRKIFSLFDPNNSLVAELKKKHPERVEYFRKQILGDPRWTASIREKAAARRITFEAMLQNDAEYMTGVEIDNLTNR